MEEDSTPATPDNGAGGNDDAAAAAAGDHSQDESSNAADKQGDKTPPSKSTDDSGAGDSAGDDDKGGDAGDGDKSGDKGAPASKFDDDLDDWAKTRGYEAPENDKERKLLQDIRNGQRDFSRDRQAKKAAETLNKATKDASPKAGQDEDDDDGDPLEKDVKSLKDELKEERVMRAQSEYFTTNNVTEDEAKAMGDFLKEKVERAAAKSKEAAKAALDYWTDPENLEDWHQMAKARMGSDSDGKDEQEIADEAARKERERIQKEHQASGSSRSASTTRTSDKTEDEKRLERFSNWD